MSNTDKNTVLPEVKDSKALASTTAPFTTTAAAASAAAENEVTAANRLATRPTSTPPPTSTAAPSTALSENEIAAMSLELLDVAEDAVKARQKHKKTDSNSNSNSEDEYDQYLLDKFNRERKDIINSLQKTLFCNEPISDSLREKTKKWYRGEIPVPYSYGDIRFPTRKERRLVGNFYRNVIDSFDTPPATWSDARKEISEFAKEEGYLYNLMVLFLDDLKKSDDDPEPDFIKTIPEAFVHPAWDNVIACLDVNGESYARLYHLCYLVVYPVPVASATIAARLEDIEEIRINSFPPMTVPQIMLERHDYNGKNIYFSRFHNWREQEYEQLEKRGLIPEGAGHRYEKRLAWIEQCPIPAAWDSGTEGQWGIYRSEILQYQAATFARIFSACTNVKRICCCGDSVLKEYQKTFGAYFQLQLSREERERYTKIKIAPRHYHNMRFYWHKSNSRAIALFQFQTNLDYILSSICTTEKSWNKNVKADSIPLNSPQVTSIFDDCLKGYYLESKSFWTAYHRAHLYTYRDCYNDDASRDEGDGDGATCPHDAGYDDNDLIAYRSSSIHNDDSGTEHAACPHVAGYDDNDDIDDGSSNIPDDGSGTKYAAGPHYAGYDDAQRRY